MRLPALCFRMDLESTLLSLFCIIFCCWMMSLRPLKMIRHRMILTKLSLRPRRCFLKQIHHHYMMSRLRCMKICCLNCLNPKNTTNYYRNFFSMVLNNFLNCYRKSLTCLQVNMRNCSFRLLPGPVCSSVLYWFCLWKNRCLLCCY